MSIWILIWFLLSFALLFFAGWTFYILYRQRATWKAFAESKKLRYRAPKFFSFPEIGGEIDGYTLALFPSEHAAPDARGSRKLTAVEVTLKSTLPFDGAVATGGLVPLVEMLDFPHEVRPKIPGWDENWIVRSKSSAAMDGYLTQKRLESLLPLMKIGNGWLIVIFRGGESLLRMDLADPLYLPGRLEKITKGLINLARVLELESAEKKKLEGLVKKGNSRESVLADSDDAAKKAVKLELESDELDASGDFGKADKEG